ncbi:actin-related protein 8-like isoform X2 [Zingiber officinale]|uniref:actin-related protein 8-like isoform X2 n=1 Tax=Zingiber officinale TaxID=94328 RepID=UPI001C4BE77D|nr:actin-related protein 8-like isoform X2 [Zingiber officinale]
MAVVLRKVLGSVLHRSGSSSSRHNSELPEDHPPLGDLNVIPNDVFVQILLLLGPRDAARTSSVCKSWRALVSGNAIWVYFIMNEKEPWDALVFAETHLQLCFVPPSQLSFMNIYSKRAMVPGSIIIDGGSGYCKYGWSKSCSPSGRCATFLEFGNLESPMHARFHYFFTTIFSRMQVKTSSQPVVVSLPICYVDDTESARASRKQLKEAIYSVLFEMNVPAVCAIDQAVLALFAARRTSGIVVNIGFHVTSVVPIFEGIVRHDIGIEIVGQGALKLTAFLRELMQQRNINFESLYTVRTIKEKLCYVAADYEAELQKDTEASCEVVGEGWFTLSKERFKTGEILFQPLIGGLRTLGLHRAVALCMDHCVAAEATPDNRWFKTVVLAGGTSCLPGLSERLEKELCKILPASMSNGIEVIPPPCGADSAWHGAKIVSSMSTFMDSWCITKKQYRQMMRRNMICTVEQMPLDFFMMF